MSNVATSLKSFPHCLPKHVTPPQSREVSLEHFSNDLHQDVTALRQRRGCGFPRLWFTHIPAMPHTNTPDVLKVQQADIWLLSNQFDWVPLDRLEPVRAAAHTCWAAQNLMLFDHLLRSQLKHSAQNTGKSGLHANMGTASTNAIGTFAMSNHP